MRTFLKIIAVLIVLIALFLIWALNSVDYQPYFDSDYYKITRSRLDSLDANLSTAYGQVYIGFAKESITPELGAETDDPGSGKFESMSLAGYGSRKGEPATGIHDSVFIKAVAIRVQDQLLVLVGSDLLIVPPNISSAVADRLKASKNIERFQLFFSATHTHSSAGAWQEGLIGESFAGPYNPNVPEWLIARYSSTIARAIDDLEVGAIGTGTFKAADFVMNRLIGDKGQKNTEFVYVVAEKETGKRAILGAFDAHATVLGASNLEFSGDYPGYWQRKLESETADLAIFYAGSVGSHRPVGKGEKFERARHIGEALADSVSKYCDQVELSSHIDLASMSLNMALPELHIRISDGLRLNQMIGKRLIPTFNEPSLQAARIGNLIWATAPCDYSGELAIELKNMVGANGYKGLVTSFNGNYVGYIIPCRYYHLNEYESRTMSWYGPYMGPYTQEMLKRMMQQLSSTPIESLEPFVDDQHVIHQPELVEELN